MFGLQAVARDHTLFTDGEPGVPEEEGSSPGLSQPTWTRLTILLVTDWGPEIDNPMLRVSLEGMEGVGITKALCGCEIVLEEGKG